MTWSCHNFSHLKRVSITLIWCKQCLNNYIHNNYIMYAQTEFYVQEQVRRVDDNENSVFKHDRFLVSFQVFKSCIATIIPFKYRVFTAIYFSHLFLYMYRNQILLCWSIFLIIIAGLRLLLFTDIILFETNCNDFLLRFSNLLWLFVIVTLFSLFKWMFHFSV